ncbi:hypothetical protein HDU87_001301 [Geranomyces variabilis]|uniref:Uncharacterized protein n=1 Tax=Geranomyces variabilis TaxID=109894 RepID=A0AAD5TPV4_9FUNG|nr:hypothetical protein HDU87_001301 [Geranomyces variabilis]
MPSKKAIKSSKLGTSASADSPPSNSSQADAAVDAGLKLGRRDGGGPRANALLARRIQFLELPAAPVQPRQAGSLRRITPGKAMSEVVSANTKKVDGATPVEHNNNTPGKGAERKASSKPAATTAAIQKSDALVPTKGGDATDPPIPATTSVPLSKKRKAELGTAPAEQELGVVISRKKVAKMAAKKPATTTTTTTTAEGQQTPAAVASSAVPLPEIPAPGPKPNSVQPKAVDSIEERPVIATPKPRAARRPQAVATTPAEKQHATNPEPVSEPAPPPAFAGQFDLERPPPTNANHIPLIPRVARANNNGPTLPVHNDPQIGVPVAQWTDDLATHATNVQRARLLHMHKPQIRRADDWDKDYDRGYEKKRKVKDGEAKPRRGRR